MAKTFVNFEHQTLYRAPHKSGPLSRAEVASIFKNLLSSTASMWIERQPAGRMLCVQERDDGPIQEVGIVANTVRVGAGDFTHGGPHGGQFIRSYGSLRQKKDPMTETQRRFRREPFRWPTTEGEWKKRRE
jgi:hypothetical protein